MGTRARRHPVTLQIGIAHRGLNEFSDWLGSRPHQPSRWSLCERTHFFNPDAQLAWHPDTPLDQVIAEIEPAFTAATTLAEPSALRDYLWNDEPLHVGFHRRNRIAHELLTGWNEASEQELTAWKETTASNNAVTLAEATLRKYLETGQTPTTSNTTQTDTDHPHPTPQLRTSSGQTPACSQLDQCMNLYPGPLFAQRPVDMAGLMSAAKCPVILGAGEADPMVTEQELAAYVDDPRIATGSGHNPQVEDPVWFAELIQEAALLT